MGSHVGTYEGSVEELDLAATAPADTDYSLTLDEAFCDGNYVYLTLQLTGPEEAEQYDHYVMYLPNEEGARLTVNGQETELFTTGGQAMEDGTEAIALVYQLAAPAEDGQALSARWRWGACTASTPRTTARAGAGSTTPWKWALPPTLPSPRTPARTRARSSPPRTTG